MWRTARRRTRREWLDQWSAAAELSHPNLVKILSAGTENLVGRPWVYAVAEKPDDNLGEVVAGRPLTVDEAREALRSTLEGLAHLHSRGYTHGAVQASSIVAVEDRIKLNSWSVAPGGETETDIVAVGQTIVEMLTQRRPSPQADVTVSKLPSPFGQLAAACLGKRYSAAEALEVLEGRPPALH